LFKCVSSCFVVECELLCIDPALNLFDLSARAAQESVDPEALETARDGHDPRAEIIALIMAQRASAQAVRSTRHIQGP
jgi:hypothetical protein